MNRRWLAHGLLSLFAVTCLGQEPDEDAMSVMRQRALALQVTGKTEAELKIGAEPVLRYNDAPRRITDASVWRIGERGRPRAVLVLEIYSRRSIQYEFTAVADPPASAQADSWQWSPTTEPYPWVKIPVESISEEQRLRQLQIRQLAHDFTASEEFRGETYQLRLMPRPLHEYTDKQNDVLEGAMFAWAHGTNVEILMFLELQVRAGKPAWVAGFSRLGSASLHVRFQDQEFWTAPTRNRPTKDDPYFYRMDSLNPQERAKLASDQPQRNGSSQLAQ